MQLCLFRYLYPPADFCVAMLSSAVRYPLETEVLRKIPTRVSGVLMSLESAIAVLVGFIVLSERLGLKGVSAILLVTVAAAEASRLGARTG